MHGVISNIRWTFPSVGSLPCVPDLFDKVLMLSYPLPGQSIKLIKPMEVQSTDPLGTAQRLDTQTMPDNASTAVGPSASAGPCRSSPTIWILQCSHVGRGLWSASYGRPVACLVQTRSLIMGQTGSIVSQIWRACNRLRSLRIKTSVTIWFVMTCSVFCRGHMLMQALTSFSHWSISIGPGSRRLTMIRLLGALSQAAAAFCMNTS